MMRFATELAARGINAVTFNFLYTEQGRRIPDTNNKLEACFRAVIETVRQKKIDRGTLVIGGKSMGGRIASQIAAAGSPDVEGLVFLGYPLHPPGKVDQLRAMHLSDIKVPMLFVQGSRDPFGTPDELRPIIKTLKAPADLYVVEGGDHSFKVLKRARHHTGRHLQSGARPNRIVAAADLSRLDIGDQPCRSARQKATQVRADKSLKEYAGKRDFARTPEPVGSGGRRRRPRIRRAEARGAAAALRPAARDGRSLEELGGHQRPEPHGRRKATCGPHRGPPDRIP